MRKNIIYLFLSLFAFVAFAQEETEDAQAIREKIDELTFKWDNEAVTLQNYTGLTKFCQQKNYRYEIIDLLKNIHHYDSVLYERAAKAAQVSNDRELKKLMKDIESFEEEYSMKDFIHFMREDCEARNNIEKNSEELKASVAEESYDNQIYVIETELQKYVKHITKRVDKVREHVHHLVK